jgi:hypothetical protein
MTCHYINANLTEIITEAWSNVGLYTPPKFPHMDIFYDQKLPNWESPETKKKPKN